jgi:hypothetical protein
MSRDAGANVDRGVFAAGANYLEKDFSIGAANYYSDDIINIFYTEGKYAPAFWQPIQTETARAVLRPAQHGQPICSRGRLFPRISGVFKADLSRGRGAVHLGLSDTSERRHHAQSWSGYPGYTSVQVQDFFRAGESALMLRAALRSLNQFKGASVYALWVHGARSRRPQLQRRRGRSQSTMGAG